jgi:hypothetical protein
LLLCIEKYFIFALLFPKYPLKFNIMKHLNNYSKLAVAVLSFFIFNFSIIPHLSAGNVGSSPNGTGHWGNTYGYGNVVVCSDNVCNLTVSITQTNITCFGGNNGSATANPSSGTSPYTYNWTPGNITTQAITGLSSGTYTVSVVDASSCTATASVAITQPVRFIYISTGVYNNVTCNGGSNGKAGVNPVGGSTPYTYSWINAASNVVSTIQTSTGLTAGSYTVSVSDSCGVTHTGTVTISQPNAVSAQIVSVTNVGCYGGNGGYATATATGGAGDFTYLWTPGHNTNATASGLTAGTYTVTVADKNGCLATNSPVVTITQPAQLVETLVGTTNASCYSMYSYGSATINVTGGTSPYTYLWPRNTSSTQTCTTLSAGTYTITVRDKFNCPVTPLIITITSPPALVATKGSIPVYGNSSNCNGSASITMNGGTPPYTYSWSPNGQTTSNITGLCVGSYCCTITDNNACIDTACFNITFTTGTQNIYGSSSVSVYPDHTNGPLTISGLISGQTIGLYNDIGQMVYNSQATQPTMNVDISGKANGVYMLRIANKDGSIAGEKKIVKTN